MALDLSPATNEARFRDARMTIEACHLEFYDEHSIILKKRRFTVRQKLQE